MAKFKTVRCEKKLCGFRIRPKGRCNGKLRKGIGPRICEIKACPRRCRGKWVDKHYRVDKAVSFKYRK